MNNWEALTLDTVCLKITDGAHSSPPSVLDGKPMASVKDLTPYGIRLESCRRISDEDFKKLVKQGCQPMKGDVLIAKDGATALDTVCEVKQTKEVVLLSSVAILRPNPSIIDSSYLHYFLDASTTRSSLKGNFISGAAIPRVVLKDLKRAVVTVPPLPVQKRIAGILSAYDELIQNNQGRIKILETMARALYREWFVNFRFPGHESIPRVTSPPGEIPQGWKVKKLADIAESMRRNVSKGELAEPSPYVGLEHIPRRSLALDAWETATELGSNKLEFKKGEVLFGKIRPYFHKVSVAPFDGLCSADTIVIRSLLPEHYAFVVACVSSDAFVAHASATANGAKMPRANWDVLEKYELVVPKGEMAEQFSVLFADIVAQQQKLNFQIKNLRRTRDLLLPRLLSGQINLYKIRALNSP